jgi:hypothetical protein
VRAIEWADFGFKLWSKGPLPNGQGYEIKATVTLTDLYPEYASDAPPNGDMPWFSANEATGLPVVYFSDCVTTLLFPSERFRVIPQSKATILGTLGHLAARAAFRGTVAFVGH